MEKANIADMTKGSRKDLIEFFEEQLDNDNNMITSYGLSKTEVTVNGEVFDNLEDLDDRFFL